MAKRNNTDDAVNAAIPGVIRICTVVDVVFGGDGGVGLGDIFLRADLISRYFNLQKKFDMPNSLFGGSESPARSLWAFCKPRA